MNDTNRHFKDTIVAGLLKYENQLEDLAKYLIKNRNEVVISSNTVNEILSLRSTVASPISLIYDQLIYSNGYDKFSTLYIDNKNSSLSKVPDIIASNSLNIDFSGTKINNSLTSLPEVHNKIVVNMTQLTKINNGRVIISDMTEFQSLYVKGILCRSYDTNEQWFNSSICEYLIETYAISIATKLFNLYNLDLITKSKITVYLAVFMASKLSDSNDDPLNPRILNRCSGIGHSSEVREIVESIPSIIPGMERIDIVNLCNLIANSGPDRLSNFTLVDFYRNVTTLGFNTDLITTQIAVEYPPYWCYLILHALGGARVFGLIQQLKQNRLLDKGKKFLVELKTSDNLYK